MNTRQTLAFRKMNGLGNDFVILDARAAPLRLREGTARAIASRESGVGCDQVIVLEDTPRADVRMRIFNPDGGEVGACGNATRCVAALLETSPGRPVTIETLGGLLSAELRPDGLVSVDMGRPRFGWADIPLAHEVADTRAVGLAHVLADGRALQDPAAVNVGNPHAIFWVTDVDSYDLASFGPALEHHPMFPERANISLAEVMSGGALKLRVWERGAGQTLACGTAACAAAVCAARTGRTGREADVMLPGGALHIDWRAADDHIVMTGPVTFEFAGVLHLPDAPEPVRFDRVSAFPPA
jgi:diaminopimelate epimerase